MTPEWRPTEAEEEMESHPETAAATRMAREDITAAVTRAATPEADIPAAVTVVEATAAAVAGTDPDAWHLSYPKPRRRLFLASG